MQFRFGAAARAAFSLFAFCFAVIGLAQEAYPNKPITMIVPFPPGGLADLVARPVAEAMSRDLGQPVVIENKGGAGGGIGMGLAAKAPADGYTILLSLSSFSVIPEADALLGRWRYRRRFGPRRRVSGMPRQGGGNDRGICAERSPGCG